MVELAAKGVANAWALSSNKEKAGVMGERVPKIRAQGLETTREQIVRQPALLTRCLN